jgi:tetratricopeptide (TPR) repeat protein
MWLGEWDEARDHVQFAAELDPLAPFPHGILSAFYFNAGELERAERASRRAIEVEPRYSSGRLHLASILGELGRHEEAIAQIEQARADMSPEADTVFGGLAQLATAHALAGNRDTAQALLRRAVEEGNPPPWIGWAYAALDDLESAFQWLRRSSWLRDQIARLKLASGYRYLAPLRADARFDLVLREMQEVWGMRDSTARGKRS